jgi:hypothetical protein
VSKLQGYREKKTGRCQRAGWKGVVGVGSVDAPLGLGARRKGSSPMAMSRDLKHALDPRGPWENGHGERNAEI